VYRCFLRLRALALPPNLAVPRKFFIHIIVGARIAIINGVASDVMDIQVRLDIFPWARQACSPKAIAQNSNNFASTPVFPSVPD